MENGEVSAAEIRREKRRQKILANSNDRMKRIIGGYSDDVPEDREINVVWQDDSPDSELSQPDTDILLRDRDDVLTTSLPSGEMRDRVAHTHTPSVTPEPDIDLSALTRQSVTPEKEKVPRRPDVFGIVRTLLVLIAGILVRFSFLFPFGQEYVQTILNPFLALEVAIIGYQISVDMDLGEHVTGGIWLSTLVLAGIKPDVITTYKSAMGVASAVAADFMIFFLGFVIIHLIV